MKRAPIFYLITLLITLGCNTKQSDDNKKDIIAVIDSIFQPKEEKRSLTANDITLNKDIQYENYLLDDEYPYNDTVRTFQWDKIKEKLAHIDNEVAKGGNWAIFSNYKNMNGEAPTVADFVRNEYKRVSDQYGVERYQSVPLYTSDIDTTLTRYGRDGWLVKILDSDTTEMVKVSGVSFEGEYLIPQGYLVKWGDTISINKVAVVDVTNQNIAVIEKREDGWYILSMNPATTGVHNPPYALETPVGVFAVQEQKQKMYYTKDGSSELAGYAPFASRFTNGGYIHGVPVQYPRQSIIEWSPTLGTIPRSHMCVRNASSHSEFIYDWATVKETVVVVID